MARKQTPLTPALITLGAVAMFLLVLNYAIPAPASAPDLVACTNEAKICPDGTAVGRTGSNCVFAPCPDEKASNDCVRTGCSGQLCSDKEEISTCEFLEEYMCYKNAVCERQTNGACGWTESAELTACLEAARIAVPQ
jgi:hypothetical protein